jgi:hypothetical protein
MTVKYQVTSQLTGMAHEAYNWEDAKSLQQQIMQEYIDSIQNCFAITALIQNEDGSWTYAQTDENGSPLINNQ